MAKTKPIGKLVEQASTLLQLLVRLKASDDNGYCSCVTCGATSRYNEGMQGGHFIPRGKSPTRLLEENIHPQCSSCNGFGMKYHGKEAVYTLYMIDMYGKPFVEGLIEKSQEKHKWCRADLMDEIADLRARIKVEEARVS